jgi:XTP/dITP diphosphohydrolase
MDILLATGNPHKKDEFERILHPHRILIPSEIGLDFDPEESGATYLDNALIKARALAETARLCGSDPYAGLPVLADDSGLSVPALGGAPGVLSARYGSTGTGRDLESAERNALLLRNMDLLDGGDRQAFFVCCMVLLLDDYRVFTAQETFSGVIARAPAGSGGFGYDPVFLLPSRGCTVAELEDREKDAVSHRGRAGLRVRALLDSLETSP